MEDKMLDIIVKLYEKKLKLDTDILRGTKREKVKSYIEVLEDARKKVMESNDKDLERLFREFYYDLYVIKEENIPEYIYQEEARIAKERGLGDIYISEEYKKEKNKQIIQDQKESLDKWLDYFLWDEEAKHYSGWEVFWVLEGIQKLGKYDKEKKKYTKRDKSTIYPFPEVEKQVVFNTLGIMQEYLKNKSGSDEIRSALGQGNFKALYEYAIIQLSMGTRYTGTEGIWIKYDQGSDYNKLRDSLQGYKTEWCTAAGESFAKDQLAGGDFYVYYTKDENDEYKVPRIAIRMEGQEEIGEIRGIEENQNVEGEMLPILNEKLKEFPDKEKYLKKEHDMLYLTEIYKKQEKEIELTLEDLRFLYEIDSEIEGFGWKKDPRIEEIKNKRNIKRDLSIVFKCREDQIAISNEDLNEETVVCCVNLTTEGNEVYFPKLRYILGYADFSSLTSAKGLETLQVVRGFMFAGNLKSARGLNSLQRIGKQAGFAGLIDAHGLESLHYIGTTAAFDSLIKADGLENLQIIGKNACFDSLTNAKGLKSLTIIGDDACFDSLTSAKGLESLQRIGGTAFFNSLTSVKGLESLRNIGVDAYFNSLQNIDGDVNTLFKKIKRVT